MTRGGLRGDLIPEPYVATSLELRSMRITDIVHSIRKRYSSCR